MSFACEAVNGEDSSDDGHDGYRQEDGYVPEVDHTAREGGVVVLEQGPIEDEAGECAEDEADDLALAEGCAEESDGHEGAGKEDESDEGAEESSAIKIAHGFRHVSHDEIMDEARQQADEDQGPRGEILPAHDPREGHGFGTDQIPDAGLAFLGEQAHGEGRAEEHEEPGTEQEESVHLGIPGVNDIPLTRDDPKEEADRQLVESDDYIGDRGREVIC